MTIRALGKVLLESARHTQSATGFNKSIFNKSGLVGLSQEGMSLWHLLATVGSHHPTTPLSHSNQMAERREQLPAAESHGKEGSSNRTPLSPGPPD